MIDVPNYLSLAILAVIAGRYAAMAVMQARKPEPPPIGLGSS